MRTMLGRTSAMLIALAGCAAEVTSEDAVAEDDAMGLKPSAGGGTATTGNGAPSGSHYQVNIIGVSNPKTTDLTNNGRRIFVPLAGTPLRRTSGAVSAPRALVTSSHELLLLPHTRNPTANRRTGPSPGRLRPGR